MSKRWKQENDLFLVAFEGMGANWVANHDLGFQAKNAGEERIAKLKETGVYDKIKAYEEAKDAMQDAWTMAFGPKWAKELVEERIEDLPWTEYGARLNEARTTEFYSTQQLKDGGE